MADSSVSVAGPVTVRSDSAERVAYELMMQIATNEGKYNESNRDYWLTLYWQCRKATNYSKLESILEKK